MNIDTLVRILQDMGYTVKDYNSAYLELVDPSCIYIGFKNFMEYAWVILVVVTGIMLFGWGVSLLRGAKNDIFTNMRNLIMIFGIVSVTVPIINVLWGDDIETAACDVISIPMENVHKILETANTHPMSEYNPYGEFERVDIYDSGAQY